MGKDRSVIALVALIAGTSYLLHIGPIYINKDSWRKYIN